MQQNLANFGWILLTRSGALIGFELVSNLTTLDSTFQIGIINLLKGNSLSLEKWYTLPPKKCVLNVSYYISCTEHTIGNALRCSWAGMELGFRNQWELKFERWLGIKVGNISTGDVAASINMLNVVFSNMINSKIYRSSICSKWKKKKQARACSEPLRKEKHWENG